MHESAFFSRPEPERRRAWCVDVPIRGVSVAEFVGSGVVRTASPWILKVAALQREGSGDMTARFDPGNAGQPLSAVVGADRDAAAWRAPTVHELVEVAVMVPEIRAPFISPEAHDVGPDRGVPWVPYVCGELLGMWPVSHRVPDRALILTIRKT